MDETQNLISHLTTVYETYTRSLLSYLKTGAICHWEAFLSLAYLTDPVLAFQSMVGQESEIDMIRLCLEDFRPEKLTINVGPRDSARLLFTHKDGLDVVQIVIFKKHQDTWKVEEAYAKMSEEEKKELGYHDILVHSITNNNPLEKSFFLESDPFEKQFLSCWTSYRLAVQSGEILQIVKMKSPNQQIHTKDKFDKNPKATNDLQTFAKEYPIEWLIGRRKKGCLLEQDRGRITAGFWEFVVDPLVLVGFVHEHGKWYFQSERTLLRSRFEEKFLGHTVDDEEEDDSV